MNPNRAKLTELMQDLLLEEELLRRIYNTDAIDANELG